MHRLILVSVLAAGVTAACSAPPSPPPAATSTAASAGQLTTLSPGERAELLAVRDSVWHRWFASDTAHLRRVLPPEFISIPNDTGVWAGLDQTIQESAGFASTGGKLVRLDFPRNEIQSFGPVSIIYSKYEMDLDFGGQRQTIAGRVTEVFVKRDGRWVHPSWHLDSGR